MKRDDIDFHLVRDEHLAIHAALENWARWVRVRPHGWQVSPMFRQYRSKAFQWHAPVIQEQTNVPEAVEMEKTVSLLPAKHREAIRWAYVWQSHPARVARELGVTKGGLRRLIEDGRQMLVNRLCH